MLASILKKREEIMGCCGWDRDPNVALKQVPAESLCT